MNRASQVFTVVMTMALLSGCAAQEYRKRGDVSLEAGKPAQALHEYQMALQEDPALARNKKFAANLRQAKRDHALNEGRRFAKAKKWDASLDQFREVLRIDGNDLTAQTEINRTKVKAADDVYQQALRHADENHMDAARAALTRALRYVPEHANANAAQRSLTAHEAIATKLAEARAAVADKKWKAAMTAFIHARDRDPNCLPARGELSQARNTLGRAQKLHASAVARADQRKLEAALHAAQQSRDIWPHNPQIEGLLDRINTKRDRARQAAEQGDVHLQSGKLHDAQLEYARALRFQEDHPSARTGMSRVAKAQVTKAEQAGQMGRALLWRMALADYGVDQSESRHMRDLQKQLLKQAAPIVQTDNQANTNLSSRFDGVLLKQIDKISGDELSTQAVQGTQYLLRIDHVDGDVNVRRTSSRQRTHRYQVTIQVANDKLDDLRRAVSTERRLEESLRRTAEHDQRDYEAARDLANPPDPDAHAKEVHRLKKRHHRSWNRYKAQKNALTRKLRELECAPLMVDKRVDRTWPYTVETHELTGDLSVKVSIVIAGSGHVVDSVTTTKAFRTSDTTILGANPQIGLSGDALNLPSRSSVSERLVDNAAKEAAKSLRQKLLNTHITLWQGQAKESAAEGKTEAALDARVNAALLTQAINNTRGREQLHTLRQYVMAGR